MSHPLFEVVSNVRVLLVQVGETSESAVFNRVLVAPVDVTVGVVVLRVVHGVDLTEIVSDRCNVVGNDVDHDRNALVVGSLNKSLEIILSSEMRVDLLPVFAPVAMVSISERGSFEVVNHR